MPLPTANTNVEARTQGSHGQSQLSGRMGAPEATQPSHIAIMNRDRSDELDATRPSYAATARTARTARTSRTVRNDGHTSTRESQGGAASSATPAGNQSGVWVPPHQRGRNTGQKTAVSATTSTRPRPELNGMEAAIPPNNWRPHLGGMQSPTILAADGGVQGSSSSVAVSTGANATGANAFNPSPGPSPGGGETENTNQDPPKAKNQVRVGSSGWMKGVCVAMKLLSSTAEQD